MGALDQLSRKSGVIAGDDTLRLFEYAQEKGFAIPAIVSLSLHLLFLAYPNGLERHLLLHRRRLARGRP